MSTEFLKENILKSRQNDRMGKNALKLLSIHKQTEFLFEKNISVFLEIMDFLSSDEDVLILTGYALSGKSLLTANIPKVISEEAVCHFFKCTASSTIDDLLLTFFETFKDYAKKNIVNIPKIETKNFHERINFYLTKCENPIVIILDGLNEMKNSSAKSEIMGFLSQVAEIKNIKLIITSREFDITDLKNIQLKTTSSIIKPLTLKDMKEYCLKNIIKPDGIEEFFELTEGHYKNLFLAMSCIQPTNSTINEFVKEVKDSNKAFESYVISKNLTLIPMDYSHLLWIMSIPNFGIPKANLMNFIDNKEEQLTLLLKKGIIEQYNDCFYIKDYFKEEIVKTVEPLAQQSIMKSIVKFLELQLPMKPAERELKLSRITIRNEIDRLKKILDKSTQSKAEKNKTSYLNILGYSKQFKTNWDGFDNIIMPKKTSYDELIDKNVEKIENQINPKEIEIVEKQQEELTSLKLAKTLKGKYEYKEALIQYQEALTAVIENSDKQNEMIIYQDIAECYSKLGEYRNAIEYFGKANKIAKTLADNTEYYSIMLKIADTYRMNYKKDLASDIYKSIISKEDIDKSIRLKAELALFEDSFSLMTPKDIMKKYYSLLEKAKGDKELSAKIHFRLGFLYDNASSLDEAELHYKKSIETCDDYNINTNLSSCYYNLAEINYERQEYSQALDFYLKSYSIDEITKKTEDLIATTRKIAKLYEKKKNTLALDYYEKVIDLAKKLNDNYPVACAYIDMGDYFYRQKQDLKALRMYMDANKIMENQLTVDNANVIRDRINDLKVRMGKDVVESLIREFY